MSVASKGLVVMKRDNSRFRETVKICGVVLVTAVAVSLAVPVMVGATGSFVTIQDDAANNNGTPKSTGASSASVTGPGPSASTARSPHARGCPELPAVLRGLHCERGWLQTACRSASWQRSCTDRHLVERFRGSAQGSFAAISTGTCAAPGVWIATFRRGDPWGDGHAAWSGGGEQDGLHYPEDARLRNRGHRIWLPHERSSAFRERRRTDHRPLELSGLAVGQVVGSQLDAGAALGPVIRARPSVGTQRCAA